MEPKLEQEYIGLDVIEKLREKAQREGVSVEELLRKFVTEKSITDRLRENPYYLGGVEE